MIVTYSIQMNVQKQIYINIKSNTMKKILYYSFILSICLSLAGCKNDDEVSDYRMQWVGTYNYEKYYLNKVVEEGTLFVTLWGDSNVIVHIDSNRFCKVRLDGMIDEQYPPQKNGFIKGVFGSRQLNFSDTYYYTWYNPSSPPPTQHFDVYIYDCKKAGAK